MDVSSREALHKELRALEPSIAQMSVRVLPASFSAQDEALAYPYSLERGWDSCAQALKRFDAQGVMMRLPLFWQCESLLHGACREAGASLFINERENMPLGRAALAQAAVDTIVTDIEDAARFSSYLLRNGQPLSANWFIVRPLDTPGDLPEMLKENESMVAQELHILPGIPIGIQCEALTLSKEPRFHLAPGFSFDEKLRITSEGLLVEFSHYSLPVALERGSTCSCGKEIIALSR